MDFSSSISCQQGVVDVQIQLNNDCEENIYNSKNNYEEEIVFKGNNNYSNSLKTEIEVNHSFNSASHFKGVPYNTQNREHTYRRALDLCLHNRSSDGSEKTIFDDAEYFSKNHSYKLLPINFENVDEKIIHTEHNYCHLSMSSGSEADEDCSRTMDYNQIKEKQYKKRKAKFKEHNSEEKFGIENCEPKMETLITTDTLKATSKDNCDFNVTDLDFSSSVQPLDLSSPLVQDEKTEHYPCEFPTSITINNDAEDSLLFDSDKENKKSNLKLIEVTITRDDRKCNYQPCDVFLSDIARLVPRLIEKDCKEIDILDRTCDDFTGIEKHRLYYIISQPNWHLFQNAKERIILTNDKSLGQPIAQKEKIERPTFLIFDQFSLTKCLADYCKEIGGCFEYTMVEEFKQNKSDCEYDIDSVEVKMSKHCDQVRDEDKKLEELQNKNDSTEDHKPHEHISNFYNLIKESEDIKFHEPQSETINLVDDTKKSKYEVESKSVQTLIKQVPSTIEKHGAEGNGIRKEKHFVTRIKHKNVLKVPKKIEGCDAKLNSDQLNVKGTKVHNFETESCENKSFEIELKTTNKYYSLEKIKLEQTTSHINSRNLRHSKLRLVKKNKLEENKCKRMKNSKPLPEETERKRKLKTEKTIVQSPVKPKTNRDITIKEKFLEKRKITLNKSVTKNLKKKEGNLKSTIQTRSKSSSNDSSKVKRPKFVSSQNSDNSKNNVKRKISNSESVTKNNPPKRKRSNPTIKQQKLGEKEIQNHIHRATSRKKCENRNKKEQKLSRRKTEPPRKPNLKRPRGTTIEKSIKTEERPKINRTNVRNRRGPGMNAKVLDKTKGNERNKKR